MGNLFTATSTKKISDTGTPLDSSDREKCFITLRSSHLLVVSWSFSDRFVSRDYKGDREGIPHIHPVP